MNLTKIIGLAGLSLCLAFTFPGGKDPLHKKKYEALVTEIKDGKPSAKKPAPDEIEFKNGKVYSSFVYDKTDGGFSDVKYEISKDSVFTDDSGTEAHYYEILAITTNDKNETINMSFTINGYDIEGTYKVIKKDIVKKHFTTIGKEKVKQKKGS